MPAHIHTSPPLRPAVAATSLRRASIVVEGFDQAGPSFEARVFLNNPAADEATALSVQAGYAGSFHIYGGGSDRDPTTGTVKPLPMTRSMEATDAVQQALQHDAELTVTVVAVPYSKSVSPQQAGLTLDLNSVSIRTDAL